MSDAPETSPRRRWSLIGPGIVVAATGVGAGDLVATLIAGSRFGYALLWAAVVGTVLKIALAEGVGRWTLASERTIFDGWSSLAPRVRMGPLNWAGLYFAVYVVIWGFVYGAAAMTATALPLAALLPILDLKVWGMLSGLIGLGFVWFGGYGLFEKVMTACVGVMFVTVVGLAVIVAHVRGRTDDPAARGDSSPAFRLYALWLTLPPMALLFMDRPFGLIVAYGVLGSLFMPFLAGTLLWLLNSRRTPQPWRNGWLSNGLLAVAGVLFIVLAGRELASLV